MVLRTNRHNGEQFCGCPRFPRCKGTTSYKPPRSRGSARVRDRDFQLNEFVHVRGRGFGKVNFFERGYDEVEVEFFKTPSLDGSGTEIVVFPKAKARSRNPVTGQRTFFLRANHRWDAGRIYQIGDDRVDVILGDGRVESMPLSEVYVRCRSGAIDPVEVIKAGVIGEPGYAGSRSAFVEASLRSRSAVRGLVGLASSRVELHRHQVEVVSRVLRDPIQRYLLADEVGLGKTIEAGAVLREFFLDHPDLKAELLVPPLLWEQWRDELQEKFDLEAELDTGRLTLSRQGKAWLPPKGHIDFLIVDEAHHIAGYAFSDDTALSVQYKRLVEAANGTDRMLLLSATPLLHNEQAFLGLLHLLDPLLYPIDGLEAFKTRVESRRDLAKRLYAFQSTSLDFILRDHSDAFREMFPRDERLGQYLGELMEVLESEEASDRRGEAVRRVRVHLSETYKLHRRVLRTRRNSPLAAAFPVRGRKRPTILQDDTEVGGRLEQLLLEWLGLMAIRKTDGTFDQAAEATLLAMLNRWQSAPRALELCIRSVLDPSEMYLPESERLGLRGFEPNDDERAHLATLIELLEEDGRTEEWVADVAQKVLETPAGTLVFCGDSDTAGLVADRLEESMGSREGLARYIRRDDTAGDIEAEVKRFRRGDAAYLICDGNAEEGRNFQYAGAAFHVDLPWNPNRLEQRIGRIDRFSSGEPVASFVRVGPDSVAKHWLHLLEEGFEVFSDSIATLQHVLSASVSTAVGSLVERGPQALVEITPEIQENLEQERNDILELEHLESIEEESRLTQGVFDELMAVESDQRSVEEPFITWLNGTSGQRSGIGLQVHSHPDDSSFKRFSHPDEGQPNLPRDVIDDYMHDFLSGESWLTFDRNAVCAAAAGTLIRPGAEFFDKAVELTNSDDLGQTYGYWRAHDDELLVARFLFRVLATDESSDYEFRGQGFDSNEIRALMRTMDDFFPPKAITVNLDHLGCTLSVGDDGLVDSPFRESDRPLDSTNITALSERFGLEWLTWWDQMAGAATDEVRQSPVLEAAKSDGAARAERAFSDAVLQVRLRLEKETDLLHRNDLEKEIERLEAFREASVAVIRRVEPTVEVVGLVLLGPDFPG
jgi:ATP-dependent helicase HepA